MSKANFGLLILCLVVITAVSVLTFVFMGKNESYKPGVSSQIDTAVAQARKVYEENKLSKKDLQNGPCLSNDLVAGWVLDLVHNPRTAIDNLAENQCQAYREGRASHFIEMDLDGNIVRIK